MLLHRPTTPCDRIMAAHASKRRKLEHNSTEEYDGSSSESFGETGAEDESDLDELTEDSTSEKNISNGAGVNERNTIGYDNYDSSVDEHWDNDAEGEKRDKKFSEKQSRSSGSNGSGTMSAITAATFKSSTFKLQVDELLKEVRPRPGKRETDAEEALLKLKKTIEQIQNLESLTIEEAERRLLLSSKVAVPFPHPRPPKDAKYKLGFTRPSCINVVGSYALKNAVRSKDALQIDLMVQMPSTLFQKKDYMEYRYFYKRAYYLACIASAIKKAHSSTYSMQYEDFHGDSLKPILVVTSHEKSSEGINIKAPRWQINVLPCIGEDVFEKEKLSPDRCCIRQQGEEAAQPTPFYNSSLRADMLLPSYLKLLHTSARTSDAFRDASILGSIWLRQRGFSSKLTEGGFGRFEFTTLMALLMQGGGPGGRPFLNGGYSTYQLFKATLQVLAGKDLIKRALVIGSGELKASEGELPITWDSFRGQNIMYKMTPWSYNLLRTEARTTLASLGDQTFDSFESCFILRINNMHLRYDYILHVPVPEVSDPKIRSTQEPMGEFYRFYHTLQRGFGDRVDRIDIVLPAMTKWEIGSERPANFPTTNLMAGLTVNPGSVGRTVDHGPSAENKVEAASFRSFWGEKAELRRFKDGSILESLVWVTERDGQSVLEQIARLLIKRHFSEAAEKTLKLTGNSLQSRLRPVSTAIQFQSLLEGYHRLENDIRALDDLPLSIRQIMPADAQLRFSSLQPPTIKQQRQPADCIIQFEGSTRWPDDLVAIQRTKIAFLLDIGSRLERSVEAVTSKVGLENPKNDLLNQAYLDIIYTSGAAFRLRIHHDREQTLLERRLKDKSLAPSAKEATADALAAYKRGFLKAPAHTQAIARLCRRHPPLSGTIILIKKWFASHLLANHISDEVIELMVAHSFLQPWPWQTPSSVQTGFLRTLHWLSRWDWRVDPLIVNLSDNNEPKTSEMRTARTKFEAWRKLDPSLSKIVLFAASDVDIEGTTWCNGHPAKVVAGRMTALAKAARAEVEEKQLDLDVQSLFVSPLSDYDFVLHLNKDVIGGRTSKKGLDGVTFKNLELAVFDDGSLFGFDPVRDFLDELDQLYGSAVLFFAGKSERPIIAGLWSPQTLRRSWKVNLAYSTMPMKTSEDLDVIAEINKDAILAEMARLGGSLIERVECIK